MKKDIWSIITAGLCIVLLIVTVMQGKKLDELSKELDSQVYNLRYELQGEISNINNNVRNVLEESNKIVLSSELKPTGIHKEDKQLLANATLNLKEWYEDTEVTLYVTIGDKNFSATMTSDGNGGFSAPVELPCEMNAENVIELAALISGGGLTQKETLGTWGDISMLLPLRSDGGGWSGPTYRNGVMSSQFNISISGQNGASVTVNNPEFWIYKNGEFVQKLEAVPSPHLSSGGKNYTVDTADNYWSLECKQGDVVEIRFRCEDEFGLGYDFLFANWTAVEETGDNTQSAGASQGISKSLELYWPE